MFNAYLYALYSVADAPTIAEVRNYLIDFIKPLKLKAIKDGDRIDGYMNELRKAKFFRVYKGKLLIRDEEEALELQVRSKS